MAERKAVNKYYPPDWDPRKGSVNKRVGQHPLRDRARKISQGILVIRFELPYNIWCGGCGSHVGMGVRYNAEKSKVGNYYTTPIYKFRMKCHLCDNYFEIQTDPKNHDYIILCGARRKEQRWDPVANEQIVPEDKATQKKMAMDAMYKLEHGSDDKVKGKEKVKNLAELESSKLSMKEDYLLNRMARDKFRTEKKLLKESDEADKAILQRGALDIELLDETESDKNLAGLLKYSVTSSYEEKQKEKRKSIEQRPLFNTEKSISSVSCSTSSSTKSFDGEETNVESKQKLSETLRLARKDPFAITKPVKLFDASSNKLTTLGIRLKHSKVTKKTAGKLKINKKIVISHLQNHSTDSSLKPSDINPLDLVVSTNCSGSSSLTDIETTSKVCMGKQIHETLTEQTVSNTTSTTIQTPITVGSNSTTNTQYLNGKEQHLQDFPTITPADISCLSTAHNTSGLSILISSYDDDGQDSDNFSSS